MRDDEKSAVPELVPSTSEGAKLLLSDPDLARLAALWPRLPNAIKAAIAALVQSMPIHDRMPVILDSRTSALWLDEKVEDRSELEELLVPYESKDLVFDAVSRRVNNPRHDDPSCLEPA